MKAAASTPWHSKSEGKCQVPVSVSVENDPGGLGFRLSLPELPKGERSDTGNNQKIEQSVLTDTDTGTSVGTDTSLNGICFRDGNGVL
jgi:hypothetical protein